MMLEVCSLGWYNNWWESAVYDEMVHEDKEELWVDVCS